MSFMNKTRSTFQLAEDDLDAIVAGAARASADCGDVVLFKSPTIKATDTTLGDIVCVG